MSDKEVGSLLNDLLSVNNNTDQLPNFAKLNNLTSKCDLFEYEKQLFNVLKAYLNNSNRDLKKCALQLLCLCLSKGLFTNPAHNELATVVINIAFSTKLDYVEEQGIWLKSFTALGYFDRIYKDLCETRASHLLDILHKCLSTSVTSFLHKMKALEMFEKLTSNIKIVSLQDNLLPVYLQKIVPIMFVCSNANLQIAAINLSYKLLPIFAPHLKNKVEYWEILCRDIQNKYFGVLMALVSQENTLFSKLWIFIVKLFGSKFHKGSSTVNSVLSVLEAAFKSQNFEIRKEAFLCWQVLIECFALDLNDICSEKRIKLLTIPLKSNNCKTEELVLVKFETWCKLFNVLQRGNYCCARGVIDVFLNFCFGHFCRQSLISYTSNGSGLLSPGKKYPSMHLLTCKAFLQIFGKREYIDDELLAKLISFRFVGPVVTLEKFIEFSKMFVDSVGEACILLSQLENCNRFECQAINDALWKSLFFYVDIIDDKKQKMKIIEEISLLILALASVARKKTNLIHFGLVPLLHTITSNEYKFFRDKNMSELLFIPIVSTVLKKEKVLLQHEVLAMFKKIFIYKRDEPSYLIFIQNILDKLSAVLKENVLPEKLVMLYNIWYLLEEELRNNLAHSKTDARNEDLYSKVFQKFFIWPIESLHRIIDSEKLIRKWKDLYNFYGRQVGDLLQNKLAALLMQDMCSLIGDSATVPAVTHFVHFVITNLKIEACTNDNCDDVITVYKALQKILSLPSLRQENLLDIFESCVTHLSKSRNSISHLSKVLPCLNDFLGNLTASNSKFEFSNSTETEESKVDSVQESSTPKKTQNVVEIATEHATVPLSTDSDSGCQPQPKAVNTDSNSIKDQSPHEKDSPAKFSSNSVSAADSKGSLAKSKNSSDTQQQIGQKSKKAGEEVLYVVSPYKFDPKKLTDHQKEKLCRRRDDIPALYQDLSQSQSQSQNFSSESFSEPLNVSLAPESIKESPKCKDSPPVDLTADSTADKNMSPSNSRPFSLFGDPTPNTGENKPETSLRNIRRRRKPFTLKIMNADDVKRAECSLDLSETEAHFGDSFSPSKLQLSENEAEKKKADDKPQPHLEIVPLVKGPKTRRKSVSGPQDLNEPYILLNQADVTATTSKSLSEQESSPVKSVDRRRVRRKSATGNFETQNMICRDLTLTKKKFYVQSDGDIRSSDSSSSTQPSDSCLLDFHPSESCSLVVDTDTADQSPPNAGASASRSSPIVVRQTDKARGRKRKRKQSIDIHMYISETEHSESTDSTFKRPKTRSERKIQEEVLKLGLENDKDNNIGDNRTDVVAKAKKLQPTKEQHPEDSGRVNHHQSDGTDRDEEINEMNDVAQEPEPEPARGIRRKRKRGSQRRSSHEILDEESSTDVDSVSKDKDLRSSREVEARSLGVKRKRKQSIEPRNFDQEFALDVKSTNENTPSLSKELLVKSLSLDKLNNLDSSASDFKSYKYALKSRRKSTESPYTEETVDKPSEEVERESKEAIELALKPNAGEFVVESSQRARELTERTLNLTESHGESSGRHLEFDVSEDVKFIKPKMPAEDLSDVEDLIKASGSSTTCDTTTDDASADETCRDNQLDAVSRKPKKCSRLEKELQRIKIDVKHSDEYKKSEKRKTRTQGALFHPETVERASRSRTMLAALASLERPSRLCKEKTPLRLTEPKKVEKTPIVAAGNRTSADNKLPSEEEVKSFPKDKPTIAPPSQESEPIIESSQAQEISVKVYRIKEMKPGEQIVLEDRGVKMDLIKGPQPTSPYRVLEKAAKQPRVKQCTRAKRISFPADSSTEPLTDDDSLYRHKKTLPRTASLRSSSTRASLPSGGASTSSTVVETTVSKSRTEELDDAIPESTPDQSDTNTNDVTFCPLLEAEHSESPRPLKENQDDDKTPPPELGPPVASGPNDTTLTVSSEMLAELSVVAPLVAQNGDLASRKVILDTSRTSEEDLDRKSDTPTLVHPPLMDSDPPSQVQFISLPQRQHLDSDSTHIETDPLEVELNRLELQISPSKLQTNQSSSQLGSPRQEEDAIATSPIISDTPTRNKELIKSTLELSPIRNNDPSAACIDSQNAPTLEEEAVDAAAPNSKKPMNLTPSKHVLDTPSIGANDPSPLLFNSELSSVATVEESTKQSEKENRSLPATSGPSDIIRRNKTKYVGRSAQMMDLISAKTTISSNPVKTKKHTQKKTEVYFSPMPSRVMKMMECFEKPDKGLRDRAEMAEKDREENGKIGDAQEIAIQDLNSEGSEDMQIKNEDILTFSRALPSPYASPYAGILKKPKESFDSDEGPSRSCKRRRVNFSDPPVSCRKFIEKTSKHKYHESLKPSDIIPQEPRVTRASKNIFSVSPTSDLPSDVEQEHQDTSMEELKTSLIKKWVKKSSGPADSSELDNIPQMFSIIRKGSKSKEGEKFLRASPEKAVPYDDADPICSALANCTESVRSLVPHLTSIDFMEPLLSLLDSSNIVTVGDLARLTELQVYQIPLKVEKVRYALNAFNDGLNQSTPIKPSRRVSPTLLFGPKSGAGKKSCEVSVITSPPKDKQKSPGDKEKVRKDDSSLKDADQFVEDEQKSSGKGKSAGEDKMSFKGPERSSAEQNEQRPSVDDLKPPKNKDPERSLDQQRSSVDVSTNDLIPSTETTGDKSATEVKNDARLLEESDAEKPFGDNENPKSLRDQEESPRTKNQRYNTNDKPVKDSQDDSTDDDSLSKDVESTARKEDPQCNTSLSLIPMETSPESNESSTSTSTETVNKSSPTGNRLRAVLGHSGLLFSEKRTDISVITIDDDGDDEPKRKVSKSSPNVKNQGRMTPLSSSSKGIERAESTSKWLSKMETRRSPTTTVDSILNEEVAAGSVQNVLLSIINLLNEKKYDPKPVLQILFAGISNFTCTLAKMGLLKIRHFTVDNNWESVFFDGVDDVEITKLMKCLCSMGNISHSLIIQSLLLHRPKTIGDDFICEYLSLPKILGFVAKSCDLVDVITMYEPQSVYSAFFHLVETPRYSELNFKDVILDRIFEKLSVVELGDLVVQRTTKDDDLDGFLQKIYDSVPCQRYLTPVPNKYLALKVPQVKQEILPPAENEEFFEDFVSKLGMNAKVLLFQSLAQNIPGKMLTDLLYAEIRKQMQ